MDLLGPGDLLVVWKLDRVGRSIADLIHLLKLFGDRGIEFRSLTDGIDTTTAGGRLVFHIMGALAEFERDLIQECTRAGLRAAKKAWQTAWATASAFSSPDRTCDDRHQDEARDGIRHGRDSGRQPQHLAAGDDPRDVGRPCQLVKVRLQQISGAFSDGYALDKHIVSSVFIGHNDYGHPQFDTTRTAAGEAVFQLKYCSDFDQVKPLAKAVVRNIVPHFPKIGLVMPAPASTTRKQAARSRSGCRRSGANGCAVIL